MDQKTWPLWASKTYSQCELAERLQVTPRTIRRAVQRGDIEKIGEEQGQGVYRLNSTPWTREKLSGHPPGQPGHEGGHVSGLSGVDRAGHVRVVRGDEEEDYKNQSDKTGHEGGHVSGGDVRVVRAGVRVVRVQDESEVWDWEREKEELERELRALREENAGLKGEVKQLTYALELATKKFSPWWIRLGVKVLNWIKSRSD